MINNLVDMVVLHTKSMELNKWINFVVNCCCIYQIDVQLCSE